MTQPWHDHPRAGDLDLALRVVREASQLCHHVQSSLDLGVLRKDDRSPVTVADFGAQALVCRGLLDERPDDPVIAEENADALRTADNAEVLARVVSEVGRLAPGADASAVCRWIDHGTDEHPAPRAWTLDPIDGTKGFLRGEQYAVALALLEAGDVVLGVLGCPNLGPTIEADADRGTFYAAIKGAGAWRVGWQGDAVQRLAVSAQTDPAGLRFCESVESAHTAHGDAARLREHLGIRAEPRRIDSQAKYAVVARGEAEGYLRLPRGGEYREKIWDHAAGMLVVTEAGGQVTDIAGRPLEFGHGHALVNNRGVVASNGHLHAALIEGLRELGISGR